MFSLFKVCCEFLVNLSIKILSFPKELIMRNRLFSLSCFNVSLSFLDGSAVIRISGHDLIGLRNLSYDRSLIFARCW